MAIIATDVRRQTVSVLFVDIVGFTTLVDELDCAEVRAVQMDYFTAVSAVVREHGGVVEKYVGDAVMAVFGLSSRRPEGAPRRRSGAAWRSSRPFPGYAWPAGTRSARGWVWPPAR
ncbi:adenylate/guanylate cyclase domain-containing protein [Actinoplanes sp. NBRC 103695]|uniref:adenylate/guanylate cyclase domain-containing protein n=1 Tax=Actinoplanes sp. NBRC 103695 TaxID=3032202 RepID=UPI0024A499CD|nr:adenylate/guanylate cyclase domain-containing protein [Actinoplanes sp. NBRC 103695]GLY95830.1 hypothetical protein Acsp02_30850 [Actinoplanes sp. NBRC 103695]